MPQEQQLAHRVLSSLNLPYITNTSPTDTDAHYVTGSTDILTSINNYAERRPGFATAVEPTPTVFNNLQRTFTWDRNDGTFIVMFCDINSSGFAQVFKMVVGTDNSAVSIFTDVTATPFDFVISNNTLYFSNGNVAKKWDPVNGLSNWGIAMVNPGSSVSNFVGTGADGGGGTPWTNPTNFQGAPDSAFATNSLTSTQPGSTKQPSTNALVGTNFGFGLPNSNTVTGLQVALTWQGSFGAHITVAKLTVSLVYKGAPLGVSKLIFTGATPFGGNPTNLGGASDQWGTVLTPTIINDSTFGVEIIGSLIHDNTTSSGTINFSADAAQITVFQTGGPAISVSGSAGTMTATAGYTYVYCYGNSATGHISSPTLPSLSTGVFTSKLKVTITLTASTDSQVNQIRLFRTTDGGGGIYFELPTSPYPNSSGGVDDAAADVNLNINSLAPTPTFNDPPTPFQGMVYFSGRIWGFVGNKVYFSGLEEINQGVPEESFPSGLAGNFWAFDQPVNGLAVAGGINNQVLAIFCGGRLYGITGNTLDTFRRFNISQRRGCRNRTAISMLGGMVGWLDSSNQIWASDGASMQELSTDIRPDLVGLNPANCSMTFHIAGRFHWAVFSTGTKLYVYDMDMGQWMPPWTFAAQYIYSGETSPGNYVLMAATATKALQLSTSAFNDNGATYQPVMKFSLLSIVPDFGKRFSYVGQGIYSEPSRTGVPWIFAVANNAKTLSAFKICSDDDPTNVGTTYTDITANLQPPETTFNRTQGAFLTQQIYPTTSPSARFIGAQIVLANADQTDNLYEMFMGYKALGGR